MNYYIQGNPERAAEIKAAFERNGIDTSANSNYGISNLFYFSCNGEVAVTQNRSIINIIKTHPDYQELELPIEPKFKVGDWIIDKHLSSKVFYVSKVLDHTYEIIDQDGDDYHVLHYKVEEDFRLWTIEDAKDGDVLVDTLSGTRALTILFRSINEDDSISAYCGWNGYTFRVTIDGLGYGTLSSTQYVPATKEQRYLLFAKMKEAGYEWDADKKQLRKIKPHYDISNFYAGMPVLVRDNNGEEWRHTAFSHMTSRFYENKFAAGCSYWCQCIPFNDDTKHLLGTTDMCDEQYINW